MRCNESGWLPGGTHGAGYDAGSGASLAVAVPAGRRSLGLVMMYPMHPAAPRCIGGSSRRNDDAGHATESAASSLHQIQAAREVPGHRSRAVGPAARGHRRAARCDAGSACSRELPNVASDPDVSSGFLNLRVRDIAKAYRDWSARGAAFLTEPKDHGHEIRAYIRDPDGHLIEAGQTT